MRSTSWTYAEKGASRAENTRGARFGRRPRQLLGEAHRAVHDPRRRPGVGAVGNQRALEGPHRLVTTALAEEEARPHDVGVGRVLGAHGFDVGQGRGVAAIRQPLRDEPHLERAGRRPGLSEELAGRLFAPAGKVFRVGVRALAHLRGGPRLVGQALVVDREHRRRAR